MTRGALLLDTNLLILLVVGNGAPELVARHKNLRAFSWNDYETVRQHVARASRLVATTHILTETSNLLGQIGEPDRGRLLGFFAAILRRIEVIDEIHVPARLASERSEFARLGLTDAALLLEHDSDFTLLTADSPLYAASLRAGRKAINFNHIREQF